MYIDGTWVQTDATAPYVFTADNLSVGTYEIKVHARDNTNIWNSDTISITITSGGSSDSDDLGKVIASVIERLKALGVPSGILSLDVEEARGYIEDTLYELRAVRVQDEAEIAAFSQAWLSQSTFRRDPQGYDEVFVYRWGERSNVAAE